MSPVVNLTVKKERYEGDFRFQHVFIRVNSESLAFYGEQAETVEEKTLDHKLGNNYQVWPRQEFNFTAKRYVISYKLVLSLVQLCDTQQRVTGRQFFLDTSTNMFSYFGAIASYIVIAIPIFAGVYDSLDEPALAEGMP